LIWSRLPNLSNVVGAINIITDSDIGLGFSSRRVTVSTSGLIPFNTFEGSDFERPEEDVILTFKEILNKNNYTAVIRHSKGQDISAACGQLRANLMSDA
jgi:23S rRNA (adenine2503-C2)-methyltransferase